MQIRLGEEYDYLFEILLKSGGALIDPSAVSQIGTVQINEDIFGEGKLTRTQVKELEGLCLNKTFSNLHESLR